MAKSWGDGALMSDRGQLPVETHRRRTRAVRLLGRLLDEHNAGEPELAAALVVSVPRLRQFASGMAEMPLDRQLCLALHVLECVPSLARDGRRLLDQVHAAARYAAAETTRHTGPTHHLW